MLEFAMSAEPASRHFRHRKLIAGMPAIRDLTLEPFQHGHELSVLQPQFANKLAAQELYLVIEADGLRGNGGGVRKLASGGCFRGPVPLPPSRSGLWDWQGRWDFGLYRNIDSVYRFARLPRDRTGSRRLTQARSIARDRPGSRRCCVALLLGARCRRAPCCSLRRLDVKRATKFQKDAIVIDLVFYPPAQSEREPGGRRRDLLDLTGHGWPGVPSPVKRD
ncbi:hypothetical protein [Rhizobium sp. BR 315]|uniref:hypothetical protein n=1 Tax=Rhizobium sp. BR 315 TaxID=3040014 RepID=UPI003D33B264